MRVATFIGLDAFQWIALITVVMTLLLLGDAWAGHYRSGFVSRAQYAPFVSGGFLILTSVAAVVCPTSSLLIQMLRAAGWLAVVAGAVGLAFHHYYGIAKKPAGYKWFLHYLMYGAPQLAPLGLAGAGALALIAARGLDGRTSILELGMRTALFAFVAVTLIGAILQAAILHYRGAFNNPAMYGPLTAPLLAVLASVWAALSPNNTALLTLKLLLWATFLTGFIGLGMHLRGFDRQMGGLYITLFNWLEGPPAFAPMLFAAVAAVGLIAVYML
jgi:hypothetical protein